MSSIPGESENGALVPEKPDVCDQRSQKCHKITSFFPLLKLDGNSMSMNTSAQNSSSAAVSVPSGLVDLPSKEKSTTSYEVSIGDLECMSILKSPIRNILRTKLSSSKKISLVRASFSQITDKAKSMSTNDTEMDTGPQTIEDSDSEENESGQLHSSTRDAPEEKGCGSEKSKTSVDSNLINPEVKREMQAVYKARKGGSTYSAKTFASTSASGIAKTLGKGSNDTNLQCELPDLTSQPSQFNQDQQQSVSPSQNCASSSGSASSCHPEVRSGPNADQSFLPASIIEIPSQNVTTKKHRRRHFKGGTYNLYLSPYRRKKNKKKNSDTASSVKDDESSIAGTENGSVIDSEGDNSIYSEDYYSPSEKSLLGDEPASPGRVDCCSGLELPKNKEANDSQTFLDKENCKSFENVDSHSKVESMDTTSCGSLSSTLLKLKNITLSNIQNSPDMDQDMCEVPEIKIKTEPPDRPRPEFGSKCKKILTSLSTEACDQLDKQRQRAESPKDCDQEGITGHVKQISKYATADVDPNPNAPIKSENNPEIIKLLPVSSPAATELHPPSVPPITELPSSGPSDTELPSSVPQRELSSDNMYAHAMASGATSDNTVSTIAKSVKSRQRIKRRFTDDIVDTDAGILSLNCMSGLKRAKDQPSVSPRSEMKIGQGSRVECVVDMKLPPVASCTCEGNSLKPKSKADNYVVYCQAVDSFYENRLGCSNPVTDLRLVRPSVKNPFVFMCRMHLWRLKSHHSCPVCGLFCSEGSFLSCQGANGTSSQTHYFHEDCMNVTVDSRTCLHCSNSSNIRSKYLEFHSPVPPSFSHKQCIMRTKARMSVGVYREIKEKPDPKKSYIIPETGKVLSGVGLTKGSDQRMQFEEYLSNLAAEKILSPKYSILDMHSAAASGDVPKVLYMIALGFDPNYRFSNQENETALHAAAATGHLLIIHLLIQAGALPDPSNDRLYTPLMLAVENQHQDIIEYLITAGSHLLPRGDDGMTCLHLAAKAGNLEMVTTLLNARTLNINKQDEGGWTALVWATEHKHIDIVKLLVGRGADPNITDNEGNIGLHWSAFSGSMDICRIFLDHGCDVNAVNEHGDTPLHIAARQGYYECIHIFLARRGNPFVVNKAGKTPLDCCARQDSDVGMALHVNMTLKKVMSKFTYRAERVVHSDISKGKEENPIQCVNAVDEEEAPFDYYYVLDNCETSPISFDRTTTRLMSCTCVKDCYTNKCNCGNISFRCWYDKDGCLVSEFNFLDPPLLFECNRTCTCWWTCGNRVIQNGIVCRLQLFRTQGKGWGVRTLKDIPKGAFICEYVGELITDSEADRRAEDSYLFDLDYKDGDTFCLDAHFYGNISRFINHLCEPNIVPVKFFIDHQDLRYPRIAFFSSREIKAYEELGFDYGEKFWSIKYKSFTCHCNAPRCKYSKDTINETLANYNRRIKEEAG